MQTLHEMDRLDPQKSSPHSPLERLALQPLLEGVPVVELADLGLEEVGPVHVEEPLVVVHPHLHRPRSVDAVRVLNGELEVQLGCRQKHSLEREARI